jgi:hypothetical protein
MSRFETRRDAKLKKLGSVGPLVAASLCRRMVTCGNPNCKCARGEKHESWCLTYKGKGNKTKTVHVPIDMVEEVRGWVEEHKRVKKLLKEVSQLSMEIIRNHVRSKRAEARAGARRKSRSRR